MGSSSSDENDAIHALLSMATTPSPLTPRDSPPFDPVRLADQTKASRSQTPRVSDTSSATRPIANRPRRSTQHAAAYDPESDGASSDDYELEDEAVDDVEVTRKGKRSRPAAKRATHPTADGPPKVPHISNRDYTAEFLLEFTDDKVGKLTDEQNEYIARYLSGWKRHEQLFVVKRSNRDRAKAMHMVVWAHEPGYMAVPDEFACGRCTREKWPCMIRPLAEGRNKIAFACAGCHSSKASCQLARFAPLLRPHAREVGFAIDKDGFQLGAGGERVSPINMSLRGRTKAPPLKNQPTRPVRVRVARPSRGLPTPPSETESLPLDNMLETSRTKSATPFDATPPATTVPSSVATTPAPRSSPAPPSSPARASTAGASPPPMPSRKRTRSPEPKVYTTQPAPSPKRPRWVTTKSVEHEGVTATARAIPASPRHRHRRATPTHGPQSVTSDIPTTVARALVPADLARVPFLDVIDAKHKMHGALKLELVPGVHTYKPLIDCDGCTKRGVVCRLVAPLLPPRMDETSAALILLQCAHCSAAGCKCQWVVRTEASVAYTQLYAHYRSNSSGRGAGTLSPLPTPQQLALLGAFVDPSLASEVPPNDIAEQLHHGHKGTPAFDAAWNRVRPVLRSVAAEVGISLQPTAVPHTERHRVVAEIYNRHALPAPTRYLLSKSDADVAQLAEQCAFAGKKYEFATVVALLERLTPRDDLHVRPLACNMFDIAHRGAGPCDGLQRIVTGVAPTASGAAAFVYYHSDEPRLVVYGAEHGDATPGSIAKMIATALPAVTVAVFAAEKRALPFQMNEMDTGAAAVHVVAHVLADGTSVPPTAPSAEQARSARFDHAQLLGHDQVVAAHLWELFRANREFAAQVAALV